MIEFIKGIFGGLVTNVIQKFIDGDKPQTVININIGKLEKLIINQGGKELIEIEFQPLFEWLKNGNAETYIEDVGEIASQNFSIYWNKIKGLKSVSLGQKVDFFENIKGGSLNWMMKEEIQGRKVSEYLESIHSTTELSRDRLFYDEARSVVVKNDSDLKEIVENNLERKNIGGLIAFLRTNAQLSNREILNPKFLGFTKVENPNALVNLGKNGTISILNVVLRKNTNRDYYDAVITLKNNTSNRVEFFIPKGQIFENKEFQEYRQNLASMNDEQHSLEAFEEDVFPIHSFCLNEMLPLPSIEGTKGNITIFEIGKKTFNTQRELWDIIIKDKDSLQFAKW